MPYPALQHHTSADGNGHGHGGPAGRFPNERVSVATTAERSSSWHDSTPSDDGDATATPDNVGCCIMLTPQLKSRH